MNSFTTSDGSKIAFTTKGTGFPVLFIHGWSVEYHLWANQIEAIGGAWKKNYQRIYFDLPGMGKSVGAKTIHNSDDMLKNIEEFVAFLIGHRHYLLAGESYGGYLARGLLARQADKIDGLFLLCPSVVPGDQKRTLPERVVLERDERFLASLSEQERAGFQFMSVVQTEEMFRHHQKDIRLQRLKENAGFLEQLDGGFSVDPHVSGTAYAKPVLLMVGRQDAEVGFEQQYEAYQHFSRATIVVVDKAGHNLQIENRSLLRHCFLDFLSRVEAERKDVE